MRKETRDFAVFVHTTGLVLCVAIESLTMGHWMADDQITRLALASPLWFPYFSKSTHVQSGRVIGRISSFMIKSMRDRIPIFVKLLLIIVSLFWDYYSYVASYTIFHGKKQSTKGRPRCYLPVHHNVINQLDDRMRDVRSRTALLWQNAGRLCFLFTIVLETIIGWLMIILW